jgi:acetyl esterase/lipase
MEQPPKEDILKASPYAQIVRGNYKSPTYIVFGTRDDLIPWQQAQRTADALRDAGVESGLTLVQGQPHLFDLYRDPTGKRWEAVLEGYKFLLSRIGKTMR